MASKKDSDGPNTTGPHPSGPNTSGQNTSGPSTGANGRGHWDGCPWGFWTLAVTSAAYAAVYLFAPYTAAHVFARPAATAALFSKEAVTNLDLTLLRTLGTGFLSAAAAYWVEGRNAAQATAGMPTASRLNAGLLGFSLFSLALLPFHKDALSKLGLGCGLLIITNILGVIVTGTHQARRTGSASANDPAGSLASAVQAAVKALVAFPLLGAGEVSGLGEKETATGKIPSQAGLRAKLLLGASWALALTGWSYLLLPRFTLSAYFGASGDQADVLMWRTVGLVHLLLANITQNLEDAVVRGRLGTLTHKILDAGVTATSLGHLFILGPMLRAGDGGWALPAATGTWAFIFVSAASQLITG